METLFGSINKLTHVSITKVTEKPGHLQNSKPGPSPISDLRYIRSSSSDILWLQIVSFAHHNPTNLSRDKGSMLRQLPKSGLLMSTSTSTSVVM